MTIIIGQAEVTPSAPPSQQPSPTPALQPPPRSPAHEMERILRRQKQRVARVRAY